MRNISCRLRWRARFRARLSTAIAATTDDASPASAVIAPAAAPERLPAHAPSPSASTTASTARAIVRPSSPDPITPEWPTRPLNSSYHETTAKMPLVDCHGLNSRAGQRRARKRGPIDAHLTIAFVALAESRWIYHRTGAVNLQIRQDSQPLPHRLDPGRPAHNHRRRPLPDDLLTANIFGANHPKRCE